MKRQIIFPPVETADEDGLVAVGGDLEVDTLIEAYRRGIFPWPISIDPSNTEIPNTWFSPDPRGILDFQKIHLSHSFQKFLKKNPFKVTFNKAFPEVITECSRTPRKDQPGTWINKDIIRSYTELYKAGHAYSVDVWREDKLVAGIYGVSLGNFVSGESMFTHEDNASKFGLYYLTEHLTSKGIYWLDTQMVTKIVSQFGGEYISRPVFLKKLSEVDWTKKRSEIF
jgi:leucyl/phenylalanyl-tRNA--protein transferase